MDKVIQLNKFDVFIVAVSLGGNHAGHSSEIKLLTQSREVASAKTLELSKNLPLACHDYGFVTFSGGYFNSAIPPTCLFQSDLIQADTKRGLRDECIDEAAGGIDIIEDADSESNHLALHLLKIERSLSQSSRIIGKFASIKAC